MNSLRTGAPSSALFATFCHLLHSLTAYQYTIFGGVPPPTCLRNHSYIHYLTFTSSYTAHIFPWYTGGGHTASKLRLSTPSIKQLQTLLQIHKMGGTFSRMFSALAWSKKEIRILILGLVCSPVISGAFHADYFIG